MSSRRYTTEFVIKGDSTSAVQASRDLQRANSDLAREVQNTERRSEEMAASFESVSMHAQRLATVTAAATAATSAMVVSQTRNIAEQAAFARAVGVSVQTLQQWEFAAKAAGMQSGAIGDIFKDTAEKIGDFVNTGGGEAADLFEVLNLNIRDLMDLSPDKQLLAVANAFDEVGNRGAKIAFLESLGNDATLLLPLLENNAELLREQLDIADRIGVSIPQSDVDSIESANQALNELNELANGFATTVAANFAPSIVAMSQGTQELVGDLGGMSEVVDKVATGTLLVSGLLGGRLASSMVTATAATLAKVSADRSARLADAAASAANAKRTAETLRIAQSEQLAAQRAFESARAIAIATGNTTLRTKAITQMAAANQRAIAAEAAHTAAVNANSAAMGRASVVAQGMAGASRALSGALALVGGPLGAAVLAGAGIYAFREELGLTIPQIDANTTAVDKLTAGLDNMNEAAAQLTLTSLVGRLAEVRAQAEATAEEITKVGQIEGDGGGGFLGVDVTAQTDAISELGATSNETQQEAANLEAAIALVETRLGKLGERNREVTPTITSVGDAAEAAARKAQQAAEAQAKALAGVQQEMDPLLADHAEYVERLAVLDRALAEGTISEEAYGEAVRWSAEQYQRAATGAEEYEKQTQTLVSTYDRHYQKAQQLQEALEQVNQRWRNDPENAAQYARMIEGIREEMQQLALDADPAAQEMARAWEEASNRIDETFADAFAGAFDSFDDFTDQLLDGFKRLLAELAYQATLKPIVVEFTQQMGGALGIPGVGGQGGGGGFNLSSLGSLKNGWGAIQSGFGGIQWAGAPSAAAYGPSYGFAHSATSGTGATGFMGGSLQNFSGMQGLASMGAGFAGNWLGSQMFGEGKHSSTLGTIGGAVGTYFGGPLGALAGSALGSALGGIFGGSWETKDAGLNLGVAAGDITGNQYERQHKSGGWFSSSKSRTNTRALSGDLRSMLQEAYSAQEQSLALTLEVLGQQSSALNAFSSGLTRISTKGKSEAEVEQAVQEWLQNIVNRAAQSVVDPGDFALAGETTVDTLNRLATALTGVNPIMEQLHGNAFAASLAGGDAAASLVALSGGMDLFTQRADYYYQNFYSETERQQAAMDQAAQAMGAFTAQTGKIVTSADQLRDLVDGIDRNTQSGRELYAAAMQLAPALVEVENGLERVRGRFADMLSEAENALSSAEQQARSAYAAFEKQSFDQQLQLLGLLGDEQAALALQRERELLSIDSLLQETQRRIWAMEDEAAAQQDATRAGQEYARSLAQVNDQLSSTFNGISQWVDQQSATAGTPGMNLAEAGDQFARQLVLAQSGDRNALQSITQYAEQYLAAGEAMYASGGAFQRIQGDVLDALKDLPDQISAEEYLAQEIRDALQAVVISAMPTDERLAVELSRELTRLDANQLTAAQVRSALAPHATDAEISRLIREVDANGDGIISKQELANQRLAGLASGIGSTLKPMFDSIDLDASGLIDWNEFYGAFQGLASDAELRRIFRQLDEDGSGTISRLEALNRSSEGTEGNTQSLEERARDQLSELGGLVSEMTRTTDQFVGLNSGISSLSDSINALGVTQAEVARIEKERAAAEKAERERIAKERQASALVNEASGIQSKIDEFRTLAEQTGQNANGNVDRYRGYNWIDGDQSGFLDRIQDWTYSSQMAAWTARRLELADGREGQLERLRADYRSLMGKAAPFADGGIFELGRVAANSIVSTPTLFNMGLMGEAGPEAIVPLSRDAGGRYGLDASGLMRLPDGPLELPSRELPMPALPNFPLLNRNDQHDVVRDLLNENKTLRKELTALLKRIEQHGAAGVAVQQEAAKQQISELKKSNLALDDMSAAARLEASR